MNILLDFVTVKYRTGAGEYQRRIVYSLIEFLNNNNNQDINIFAVYNSNNGIAYEDLIESNLTSLYSIQYIDISRQSIVDIVHKYKISAFFIACAQYWGGCVDLKNIDCKVIVVIHDLAYEELYHNQLYYYFKFLNKKYFVNLNKSKNFLVNKILNNYKTLKLARWLFQTRNSGVYESGLEYIKPTLELIKNNHNVQVITVSNYTKNALVYYYNVPQERIRVLYSPERLFTTNHNIENKILNEIIKQKKKYWLLLFANRNTKNADKAIEAFNRYSETVNDEYLLVVGGNNIVHNPNIYNVEYLSDSDYNNALKNCHALIYPSFIEGFGYPPVEAMKYGKPVISSNTTSMPEILGDSVIYFSPLYTCEIYYAMTKLTMDNYDKYCNLSAKKYDEILKKQENDLKQLINLIIEE